MISWLSTKVKKIVAIHEDYFVDAILSRARPDDISAAGNNRFPPSFIPISGPERTHQPFDIPMNLL
jgi:hypothetical protein